MTFDKLVYADFVSGLSLRHWTDSEFWQSLGSFADNIISLTSKAGGQRSKLLPLVKFGAKSVHPRSGAHTINDFDPI